MERYRQTIYCDLGFLKSLLSRLDENSSGLDVSLNEENEIIVNMRNLILSPDVKLYMNMSREEYDKIQTEIYKKRLKAAKKGKIFELTSFERLMCDLEMRQQNNVSHLHINTQKVHYDDSLLQGNFLNAIFFSCESKETCEKAMKDYGILVVSSETIEDFQYLLFDQGVAIRKSEESDWEKCLSSENASIPCNSLIIIDNYILNDSDKMKENLIPLLDSILPKSLKKSVSFQLTIFATLKNDKGVDYEINGRYTKIMDILEKVRPGMLFSLSILKCKKDTFHDRSIASNNLFIGCGGGFDLFKNGRSQKTTTVFAFHPFFYMHSKWSRKAYSDLLNDASIVFKMATTLDNLDMQYRCSNYVFGVKQNRLMDQIVL